VELASAAGLSTGTVTQIVKRLREEGLAYEGPTKSIGVGRSRVGLLPETETQRIFGISVRADLVRFSLLDWSGAVHEERAVTIQPQSNPWAVIERFSRVLKERSVPLAAVGLAAAAFPTQAREAASDYAKKLEHVLLRPVQVLNNGSGAAIAEEWRWSPVASDAFLLVYFGAGIGGALVHRREPGLSPVVHPVEVGHIGINPSGEPCICGNQGCVERVASPMVLARQLEGKRPEELTEWLKSAQDALIYAVTSAINVLDVADVVLAGLPHPMLMRLYGPLISRLEQLKTPDGAPVRAHLSSLGDNSAAYGAALSAADVWGREWDG
jgi:predicted NBD/HSP70 family sugar kinase